MIKPIMIASLIFKPIGAWGLECINLLLYFIFLLGGGGVSVVPEKLIPAIPEIVHPSLVDYSIPVLGMGT